MDQHGVCNVCREYERHKVAYDAYFRSQHQLSQLILDANTGKRGEFDCLLLYSGGRDSTYVLYALKDAGFRVLAFTFDNGYIPATCLDNIERVCRDVGAESIVMSIAKEKMDQIFLESLHRNSTVCSGCFRGRTARSTELALAKNVPVVVTGLSRGQIWDTKISQFMRAGVTDSDEIDTQLHEFRFQYHSTSDRISSLLEDRTAMDRIAFDKIKFVDFYRYSSITKREIGWFLENRAPFWKKPKNVGACSTNCMINDAGIEVHIERCGYHNYAIPLAWDVRFGHLSRDEALAQIEYQPDPHRTDTLLTQIGYRHR